MKISTLSGTTTENIKAISSLEEMMPPLFLSYYQSKVKGEYIIPL